MNMVLEAPPLLHELRHHPRYELRRRAWCEHRDWTLYLTVLNVSLGGMFIQTSTPFAPGQRLRVSLSERMPRIVVEVEVLWGRARGGTVGIGCGVKALGEGAEHYRRLLDQLGESAR